MTDSPLLRDLGTILLAAAAVLMVTRLAKVPPILAYIAAGLLLGPLTGLVVVSPSIDLISEVGVALLLFLVGLELTLARIRGLGRVVLAGGALQVVLTAAAGLVLARIIGYQGYEAQIIAFCVTFSSTVVVVKMLHTRGEVHAVFGAIAVGLLLVQDIAVAIALTVVVGMGGEAAGLRRLADAGAGMITLAAIAVVSARWILPALFRWLGTNLEAAFVWAVGWCFAFILVAETGHVAIEIGAFIAGVTLAQSGIHEDLVRRFHPLVNLFLAVFFVSLGVRLDPGRAAAVWPAGVALGLLVLVGKPVLVLGIVTGFGYGGRTAFRSALALGQMSEFSFVLASLAFSAGVISDTTLSLIGVTGLATIAVSSAAMQFPESLYRLLARTGLARMLPADAEEKPETPLSGHIIVVGMNSLGRRLVSEFDARGEIVVAIDTDPIKLSDLPARQLIGSTDHRSVLDDANFLAAKLVVSALQIEDANNLLAHRARAAGVPACIHAFDASVVPQLESIGVSYMMVSKHDGIRQVAAELRRIGVID
ncbi:MAG: cation:proton antiporter [Longimicrobiales bacterium]